MTNRSIRRCRAHHGHGTGRRRPLAVAVLVLATVWSAGCSGSVATAPDLGAVPIPTAPASPVVPTASPGHAQLVAMGDAVRVDLGAEHDLITATGPDLDLPAAAPGAPVPTASRGTLTVALRVETGSRTLRAGALAVTDELGHSVPCSADRATATAVPGTDAVVRLTATLAAGHSTLTWSDAGSVLATWDFEVELD